MSLRLWSALSVIMVTTAAHCGAQNVMSSRLQYNPPAGWVSSAFATDPTFLSPQGGASVRILQSTAFAGGTDAFVDGLWTELSRQLPPATTPTGGKSGVFVTRLGVFRQPDGGLPVVLLAGVVRDGRGEGILFLADNQDAFAANLPAVNQLLGAATVSAPAETPKPPASQPESAPSKDGAPPPPLPPATGRTDVAGLYLATKRMFRLNLLGAPGSGSWEVGTEYYLLSADGKVHRGYGLPSVPGGDISTFDFSAARRTDPGNAGTYTANQREVVMRFGKGEGETLTAQRVGSDVLDIQNTKFNRSSKPPPPSAIR